MDAISRLGKKVTVLEEIALWKEDLGSRLWRAEAALKVTGECLYDARQLEEEVRLYTEVCEAIKRWIRKHG